LIGIDSNTPLVRRYLDREERCVWKRVWLKGAFAEGRGRSFVAETNSTLSVPSVESGHIPTRPWGKRYGNGTRGSTAYRLSSNDCTPVVVTIAGALCLWRNDEYV